MCYEEKHLVPERRIILTCRFLFFFVALVGAVVGVVIFLRKLGSPSPILRPWSLSVGVDRHAVGSNAAVTQPLWTSCLLLAKM